MINCTIYCTETGLAVIYHVILIYPISQIFVDNITVQFTTDVQQGYATIVVRYIQITFFFIQRLYDSLWPVIRTQAGENSLFQCPTREGTTLPAAFWNNSLVIPSGPAALPFVNTRIASYPLLPICHVHIDRHTETEGFYAYSTVQIIISWI